jgi:membrane protease YdiL (CAAX protease family)
LTKLFKAYISLKNLKTSKFVFVVVVFNLILQYLISLAVHFIDEKAFEISLLNDKSLLYIFVLTCIFAPILETYLFQYLIIENCYKYIKKNKVVWSILISSVVFAVLHYYSFLYIISTFLLASSYAFFYIVAKKKRGVNAYWVIVLVHAIQNFIPFVMEDVLNLK